MKEISINQINQGGIADSKYEGESNSVYKSVCLDLHTLPGVIQANYELKRDDGELIDELCKSIVVSSNGHVYFFSSESGKIWRKSSSDVYSLHYTVSASSGESKILGAMEYEGYIYWATEELLFRVDVDSTDWATDVAEWQTFDVGNSSYHPMAVARSRLWIGDGYKVANVSAPLGGGSPVFTSNALDLPSDQIVKALGSIDIQLAIGTYVDDNVNKTTIYRWDTWSPSWNMDDTIEEVGINAFIPVDNYFFVQAGKVGSIYSYDYNMLYLTKRVPGTYNMTYASRVSPNAVAFQRQLPLFGMSRDESVAQSGATPGVYSLGTVNPRLYHRVLNLEYLTSTNSNTTVIGAIGVRGNQLFVSWKDGTSAGIDTIDYSNRYDGAYLESRVIYLDRPEANVYTHFVVGYVEMPDGCSVKAYIKQNYADTWTEITLTQDTIRNKFYSTLRLESSVVEFKVELETNGADSPIIDYISLTGEDEGDQDRYRV
jgi:hypothetical protein